MLWRCPVNPSQRLPVHPPNPHLLAPFAGAWPVERLCRFTHDFLAAEEVDGWIVAKDAA